VYRSPKQILARGEIGRFEALRGESGTIQLVI
jgi:hypothetical protein